MTNARLGSMAPNEPLLRLGEHALTPHDVSLSASISLEVKILRLAHTLTCQVDRKARITAD